MKTVLMLILPVVIVVVWVQSYFCIPGCALQSRVGGFVLLSGIGSLTLSVHIESTKLSFYTANLPIDAAGQNFEFPERTIANTIKGKLYFGPRPSEHLIKIAIVPYWVFFLMSVVFIGCFFYRIRQGQIKE